MGAIVSFFQDCAEIITAVIDFVVNLIKSLIQFFMMIPTMIKYLTESIAYLPGPLLLFATMSITISVIFLTIGRGKSN